MRRCSLGCWRPCQHLCMGCSAGSSCWWLAPEPITQQRAEVEAELQGEPNAECEAIKEAMLAGIRGLQLPGNFLDELVDQLGGASKVAEMTGRRRA